MKIQTDSMWGAVRNNISCTDVAQRYGMGANEKGFMLCPFHNDTKPSLKLYSGTAGDIHSGFYCFSCGKSGSVIDLVSGYFEISIGEAVSKLAQDYGISTETARSGTPLIKHKTNYALQFESDRLRWIQIIAELNEIVSQQSTVAFMILDKPHIDADENRCSFLCDKVTRLEGILEILTEGNKTAVMELLVRGKGELEGYERELREYSNRTPKEV